MACLQLNRDYENLKMVDMGASHSIEHEAGSEGGGETGSDKEAGEELQKQVQELKAEVLEARAQISRLVEVQEALAKAALPKKQIEALFPRTA